MENYFKSPVEIPREILIGLLKSDRVSHSILDWASTQVDRKIALAILMNPRTSQQHLENLFIAFDTHFELDEFSLTKYYPDNSDSMYEAYQDAWDILENKVVLKSKITNDYLLLTLKPLCVFARRAFPWLRALPSAEGSSSGTGQTPHLNAIQVTAPCLPRRL